MTLIVHVGPPKSATSALQLFMEAGNLRDHVYWPTAGISMRGGHHHLAWVLDEAQGPRLLEHDGIVAGPELWDQLADELRAHGDSPALISTEYFSDLSPRDLLARFRHLDDSVLVLVGVRQPGRHLVSLWQELVRGGLIASFPEAVLDPGGAVWQYSPTRLAASWARAGADVALFGVAEAVGFEPGLREALALPPVTADAAADQPRVNVSASPVASEVLRRVGRFKGNRGGLDLWYLNYLDKSVADTLGSRPHVVPESWAPILSFWVRSERAALSRLASRRRVRVLPSAVQACAADGVNPLPREPDSEFQEWVMQGLAEVLARETEHHWYALSRLRQEGIDP